MSSLTNYLLTFYIARSLGASQFGAFSVAYVTYGFSLCCLRGLSSEPLMIRFSDLSLKVWRRAVSQSTGTALIVGLFTGTCALAAGVVIGGIAGKAFIALGLVLPALMLQESWRFAFFAARKGYHALINDTVWMAVQIPLLVFMKLTGHGEIFWFVIAWGMGAAVSCVVGCFQARVVPSLFGGTSWLIAHRDIGPRYLVENASSNSASTLQSYSITSLLGLNAVGTLNAAGVLMGPFHVICTGISLMTIPEGRKLLRRSPRQLPRFCVIVSLGLSALAAAWTALLLVALPAGLGSLMLGSIWRPAYPLVIPTMFGLLAFTASIGAGLGLHAMGAARHSMRSTLMSAPIGMAFTLIGAAEWGSYGTLIFGGVGAYIGTAVSWRAFVKAMQESGRVPVPRWMAVITGRRRAPSRHRRSTTTASRTPTPSARANANPDSRASLHQELTGPSRAATAGDMGP